MDVGSLKIQFETIYEEHSDAIFRHLYYRLQNRDKALDMTQEVFSRLWQYLLKGGVVQHPKAFLYRSARNAFINQIRIGQRSVSLDAMMENGFDVQHDDKDMESIFAQKEAVERLKNVHERYRDVLVMRYIEDMSVKEIAEVLGKRENTVSVRIKRGLEKLKKTYE